MTMTAASGSCSAWATTSRATASAASLLSAMTRSSLGPAGASMLVSDATCSLAAAT